MIDAAPAVAPGEPVVVNEECAQILIPTPHMVTLTFKTPGDKVIRAYGQARERNGISLIEVTLGIHVE